MVTYKEDGSYSFAKEDLFHIQDLVQSSYTGSEDGAFMRMIKAGDDLFFKVEGESGLMTTKECGLTSYYEPVPKT